MCLTDDGRLHGDDAARVHFRSLHAVVRDPRRLHSVELRGVVHGGDLLVVTFPGSR